jgi:hypothetical protein
MLHFVAIPFNLVHVFLIPLYRIRNCYSNVVYFHRERINILVYLALYLTYDNPAQFAVLWVLKMHARLQHL